MRLPWYYSLCLLISWSKSIIRALLQNKAAMSYHLDLYTDYLYRPPIALRLRSSEPSSHSISSKTRRQQLIQAEKVLFPEHLLPILNFLYPKTGSQIHLLLLESKLQVVIVQKDSAPGSPQHINLSESVDRTCIPICDAGTEEAVSRRQIRARKRSHGWRWQETAILRCAAS
uniref:Uncharacterized protein n=1 Tax=Aegilops tauschii subsp. strangulata TaxID=200361 RepID=A0A453DW35_AEGTS